MPEAILPAVRALHVAMCMSLFGALLFRVAIAPPALAGAPAGAPRVERRLARLATGSLAAALATWLAWLWFQTAAMSGAEGAEAVAAAVPVVLGQTVFGQVSAVRLGLLVAAGCCLWLGRVGDNRAVCAWLGAGLSGASLLLVAGLGHAVAHEGPWHTAFLFGMALHVLAAGAWLGSLVPLAFCLALLPAPRAGLAAQRFSPLGMACVAALIVTAWFNGWILIGSVPALLGTAYGRLALAKLALLLAMLGFAAANRFVFTPALGGPRGPTAAGRMRLSVLLEAAAGLAIVFLAGMLVMTPPAAHGGPEAPAHVH